MSYRLILEQDPELRTWLESVPWALIGVPQENIAKILVNEVERLQRFPGPKFSLITPLYQTPPRLLRELIFSCRVQSWQNWELILLDDHSPNQAHLEIAREAAKQDSRIRLVCESVNRGIGGARNRAMELASGDWIGFLDHDDLLHPQALGIFARQICEALDQDQTANFIYSNECKITEDSRRLRDFFYKPDFCLGTLLRSNYIAHLTFIERRFLEGNRLQECGYFAAGFDGVEDHEFFLRLAASREFRPFHLTEFCYYWRIIENSTSHSIEAKPYVLERDKPL